LLRASVCCNGPSSLPSPPCGSRTHEDPQLGAFNLPPDPILQLHPGLELERSTRSPINHNVGLTLSAPSRQCECYPGICEWKCPSRRLVRNCLSFPPHVVTFTASPLRASSPCHLQLLLILPSSPFTSFEEDNTNSRYGAPQKLAGEEIVGKELGHNSHERHHPKRPDPKLPKISLYSVYSLHHNLDFREIAGHVFPAGSSVF
jgi:hypothetical protein